MEFRVLELELDTRSWKMVPYIHYMLSRVFGVVADVE